jgi:hypothetical protein
MRHAHTLSPYSSRFGLPEERDSYRLKDKSGVSLLCFRCGSSSLPEQQSTPEVQNVEGQSRRPRRFTSKLVVQSVDATEPEHRSMLSCDYCPLSWHLDCLSPPLTSMPSLVKKWMCPNHAEQTLVCSPSFTSGGSLTAAEKPTNTEDLLAPHRSQNARCCQSRKRRDYSLQ